MKGGKFMNLLGIVIFSILILSIIALVLYLQPSLHKYISRNVLKDFHWDAIIAGAAIIALFFSTLTYTITRKLFIGQNTPLIDVSPVALFSQNNFTTIRLSVANYSGFDAYNIGLDVKYDEIGWINEWIKARGDKQQRSEGQKTIIDNTVYSLPPRVIPGLEELRAGETKEKDKQNQFFEFRGSLNLQSACEDSQTKNGFFIWIRVTWQNDRRHTFDEIHKYKLICTNDKDKDKQGIVGYALTLIPEGIISRKDVK